MNNEITAILTLLNLIFGSFNIFFKNYGLATLNLGIFLALLMSLLKIQ